MVSGVALSAKPLRAAAGKRRALTLLLSGLHIPSNLLIILPDIIGEMIRRHGPAILTKRAAFLVATQAPGICPLKRNAAREGQLQLELPVTGYQEQRCVQIVAGVP